MAVSRKQPARGRSTGDLDKLIGLRNEQQAAASLGGVGVAIENLARVLALQVIAEHGGTEDKERAVKTLWEWVSASPKE